MPIIPNYRADTQVGKLQGVRDTARVGEGPDIAGAVGKLGAQVNEHLVKVKQKRDLAGLMEARRKLSDFENSFYDPENPEGIAAYKGKNALGANEAFTAQYQKLKGELEQGFNPDQRSQWDGIALQFEDSNMGRLNGHMTKENDQYEKQEFEATTASLAERYSRAIVDEDDEVSNATMGELQGIYLKRAQVDGLSETAVAEGLKKVTSTAHKLAVENLKLTDPRKALEYIDRNEGAMSVEDSVWARGQVQPYVDDQIAREVADSYPLENQDGGVVANPVKNYVPKTEMASSIKSAADSLGIDAVELATFISYETGGTFDPDKKGPTTKWGQHRGLIQWGEPQAKQYGYKPGMSVPEQMKAVVRYLKDRGVKPGMSGLQVYAAINGGNVNAVNASDEKAGGRPGTVRDKVASDMDGHRKKAKSLFTGHSPDVVVTDRATVKSGETEGAKPYDEIGVYNAIQSDPNLTPRQKELAIQYRRNNQAMFDRKQADEERRNNEELARRYDQMKPGQSVKDALGGMYGYAVKTGQESKFISRAKSLIDDEESARRGKTDSAYEDSLIVMAVDNPSLFAKQDLSAAYTSGKLSASDYARYKGMQEKFLNPKTSDKAIQDHTTNQNRLRTAFATLGFDRPEKNKKKQQENKEVMFRFRKLWEQGYEGLVARNKGEKPDPKAIDIMTNELVSMVAKNPKLLYGAEVATQMRQRVSSATREQLRKAYVDSYGTQPTMAQLDALVAEYAGAAVKQNTGKK